MLVLRVFQLMFFPKFFAKASVRCDLHEVDTDENYLGEINQRILKKRKGVFISFLIISLMVVLGYTFAQVFNAYAPLSEQITIAIRLLALLIIAWAVLSRLGYESDTWKGKTLLETTSLFSFKFFYCIGLFLGVWSLYLNPKP